jgi:predicted ArsR family transcriptional regulator
MVMSDRVGAVSEGQDNQLNDQLNDQLDDVGVLAEPARRALFLHVAAQSEPVSREAAATAVGLAVHSAKFHLDRLVEQGLLDVEYRRLSGRTGPGAGRPSKLYRRSDRQLSVSLPPRSYDLAAELLASAVERATRHDLPVVKALDAVAHEHGCRLTHGDEDDSGSDELARASDALQQLGYQPLRRENELYLANCPFDRLAGEHTDLVCGMNLSLLGGILEGLGTRSLVPRLAPEPGACCVRVS